jgi:hypothetical protein
MCLGLVPLFGGPAEPLHWVMTAGMVGMGALLLARHRLRPAEAPLPAVSQEHARAAGRTVLWIAGTTGALVAGIVVLRIVAGHPVAPLSWLVPVLGLLWLVSLAVQMLRRRGPAEEVSGPAGERMSRRAPGWSGAQQRARATSSGDRISA